MPATVILKDKSKFKAVIKCDSEKKALAGFEKGISEIQIRLFTDEAVCRVMAIMGNMTSKNSYVCLQFKFQ